jgi:hypothetical protein
MGPFSSPEMTEHADMNIEFLNPPEHGSTFGRTHVVASRCGKTVHISGRVGVDAGGKIDGEDDRKARTGQAFRIFRQAVTQKFLMLVVVTCLAATAGCQDSERPLVGKPASLPGDDSRRPLTDEPVRPLGGIVLAPELPKGFTADVRDMKEQGKAAGVDIAGTLVLVSSEEKKAQERFAVAMIQQEDRVLPNKDYKITAYKGYINGSSQTWTSRGYRVEHKELPDIDLIDPDKRIRARITFLRDDHRLEVEHLIYFTDRGTHICVVADHDDDFKLLTQWADSIRPK